MKDVKLIGLYLAPHFLAISLLLAFIASGALRRPAWRRETR